MQVPEQNGQLASHKNLFPGVSVRSSEVTYELTSCKSPREMDAILSPALTELI
jgi:hypothetical protein